MTALSDRQTTLAAIDQARVQGARLSRCCEVAGIDRATYRRWQQPDGRIGADARPTALRPVPSNALSAAERQQVLAECHKPEHADLPPSQIVPRLADQGRYLASESTFYRILRDQQLQHRRGRAEPPSQARIPRLYADAPNQVWCWDVSWLKGPIKGWFFYLYLVIDLYSRKIIIAEVMSEENGQIAAELIDKALWREHCVLPEQRPRVLHADNGSPMRSATLLGKLQELGISPSYSRPRVSNDNAFAEAMFRTLKYRPEYPAKGFESLEQARQWVAEFGFWYNHLHRHSAINFVTPEQRHSGQEVEMLQARDQLYRQARAAHPSRWSGATRNWQPTGSVFINPEPQQPPPSEHNPPLLGAAQCDGVSGVFN